MSVARPISRLALRLWRWGHRLELAGRPLAARACHKIAREVWLLGYRVRHGKALAAVARRRFLA